MNKKKSSFEPKEVKNEISKIITDVLVKQDRMLKEYREEGHLYMVEENINDRISKINAISQKGELSLKEIEKLKNASN